MLTKRLLKRYTERNTPVSSACPSATKKIGFIALTPGVLGGRRCGRRRRRWRRNSAVECLCHGVQESVLSAAESVEVVGVDGPDDDAAESFVEDVLRLDLEALFVVVAEPLTAVL
jgi:hypothetical protein